MTRFLPPLNALRAFEAAARYENFTRAAEELNVTHAAISHQVKALEGWLGVALFQRLTRAVRITEAGRSFSSVIEGAFNQISIGTATVMKEKSEGTLHIMTPPAFAVRWLAPRLSCLWSELPELDLRFHVAPSMFGIDFDRHAIHLGVRVGITNKPGLEHIPLLAGSITPMCNPVYLEGGPSLDHPRGLEQCKLLHERDYTNWRRWLDLVGAEGVDVDHGTVFDDVNMVYSSVHAAQGIGLLHTAVARDEADAGHLIQPFNLDQKEDENFYIVYPRVNSLNPLIAKFREWLLTQAAE